MASRHLLFGSLLLGAGLMVGCNAPAPSAPKLPTKGSRPKTGTPVATWEGGSITSDELALRASEKNPYERSRLSQPQARKDFVDNLARFELMAEEAERRGLGEDPEVVRARQTVMVRKLVQAEIDENPAKRQVTDEELGKYYEEHKADFVRPELVRVSAIVLNAATPAELPAKKALGEKLVKEIATKPADPNFFAELATKNSDDLASRGVGGDLRFLSKAQLTERFSAELATAAVELKAIGEVSRLVVWPKGVALVRLAGRTPALDQSLEQVKGQLQSRIWFERRTKLYEAFVDGLKQKGHFAIDEKQLEAVKIATEPMPSVPPAGNSQPLRNAAGVIPIPPTAPVPGH